MVKLGVVKPIVDDPPWTPFEDRRRLRDEKREAVLRMAVRLFLEEGYHRTPLARIAERLNITKPALYNYFRSKEEILIELFRLGDELYEENFGRIERESGEGLTKLKALIRAYAWSMTTDFGMCFARLDDRELETKRARPFGARSGATIWRFAGRSSAASRTARSGPATQGSPPSRSRAR